MIVNATAYRASLRRFEAEQRRLLRLRTQLRKMGVDSADVERVLEPLKKSCQDLALDVRRLKPFGKRRWPP
jgi:DNA-binding transcriptional MerR regulator